MGLGFAKATYTQAMANELVRRKIPFERQKKVRVSRNGRMGEEVASDLVAADSILVEIKAQEPLSAADETRLKSFLRAAKLQAGLLVDFGRDHLEIRSASR